ncbi:MAG TPA: ATP-binding protein [Thermoanaerobaculia bacterium]
MRASAILQYRKDPRFVITIPVFLVLAATLVYYLVQRTKELTPQALSSRLLLFVLWNINLILILGILFVLLRVVIKLVLERQRGILGSKFRTKLVAIYVATSLVPIVVLFFIATDLLRVSIDRWFNTPVRTLIQNSEKIAQAAQERALTEAEKAAQEIAASLEETPHELDAALDHVGKFHPVDLVGAYDHGVALRLVANPKAPIHEVGEPSLRFFEEVRANGFSRKIDVAPTGKWLRVAVRVDGNPSMATLAGVFLPRALSRMVDQNIIAHQNFLQLDSQRQALKASQTLLFLTVTLYILFGALWVAIYASRRITVPIQALAEGTQTLAAGNYGHRVEVAATDEFGVLIDSFNQMSEQLGMQREALTQSNAELQNVNRRLDEERAYFATVLDSVSTGILAFTDTLELLSINGAALRMLRIPEPSARTRLDEVLRDELAPLGDYIADLRQRQARPRELTLTRRGDVRYLEASAARLKSGKGWVVALEDLTQLVQAQKLAAWSEAARRIAHEIKNPLTPIQLSAERIAKRSRAGDPELDRIVEEGCNTIVTEVGELKRLVDEFSRFARMPAIHLKQTRVAEVLDQVANLYQDVKPDVNVEVRVDRDLAALVDPEQIRRALINLLDNAIDATDRGTIVLAARLRDRSLVVEVSDPGRGVPDPDKERLFLPHFSTKGRGTGLGLAIVHRIVHDHDGRISVHDNQPKGTRFEIEIPA